MYQMTFGKLNDGQKFTCSELLCELEKTSGGEAVSAYGTMHRFPDDMTVYTDTQC